MREDMKHVIIDRPRVRGNGGKSRPAKGTLRRWQRCRPEEYPKTESSARRRKYGYACKELNEHLAPLRRWLRSNCGRPWNDVHAEICANLSVRNATSAHVRDHAEQYVTKNTCMIDGDVCDSKGIPIGRFLGFDGCYYRLRRNQFYVDPRDGRLREFRKARECQKPALDYVAGDDATHEYRLYDGAWFAVEYGLCPFTSERFIKHKQQLGKRQIHKLKLWETPLGRSARAAAGA